MKDLKRTVVVGTAAREVATALEPKVGQWYWATLKGGDKALGCVTRIGSNYVEVSWNSWSKDSDSTWVSNHRFKFSELEALCPAAAPARRSPRARSRPRCGPGLRGVPQEAEREAEARRRGDGTGRLLAAAGGGEGEPESRRDWTVSRHKPWGDPGPGVVARTTSTGSKRCRFAWTRPAQHYRGGQWSGRPLVRPGDPLPRRLFVPVGEVLNVSAYTPGDYKRFFADPRTRADYLQWAPLMLAAEDWHAGKMQERDGAVGVWDQAKERDE